MHSYSTDIIIDISFNLRIQLRFYIASSYFFFMCMLKCGPLTCLDLFYKIIFYVYIDEKKTKY